jgi:hypothetical protein
MNVRNGGVQGLLIVADMQFWLIKIARSFSECSYYFVVPPLPILTNDNVPRVTNGSKNAPELTLVHATTCEIH